MRLNDLSFLSFRSLLHQHGMNFSVVLCAVATFLGCGLVTEPQQTYEEDFSKGMNIYFTNSNARYHKQIFTHNLKELRELGINTLSIATFHYTDDISGDSVYSTRETLSSDTLGAIIKLTKSFGISPILKPHINTKSGEPRFCIEPSDPRKWINTYSKIITEYARLSENYGLEEFIIGTELDNVVDHPFFTEEVITSVRKYFSGDITYSASFDHFLKTNIWNHVDKIGVNAYFNLCMQEYCSQRVLTESWNYWLNVLEGFAIKKGKPLYFTEIGYYSRAGAAINPGDWTRQGEVRFDQQAMSYEALLCQADDFSYLEGIFWWHWDATELWGSDQSGYTPQSKPAEEVIRKYWGVNES